MPNKINKGVIPFTQFVHFSFDSSSKLAIIYCFQLFNILEIIQ